MTSEIIPRPAFDHSYRSIDGDAAYKKFETLGFSLNPDPVIHPGRLRCQFLHFLSPSGTLVYLEFLFRDEALALDADKPEDPMTHAGFALKVAKDLRQVFDEYQKDLPTLNPKFEHRNYDIKADAKLMLPGWNFLTFENPPIQDIEVWLIEYEPVPGRTEAELVSVREKFRKMTEHPNTARRILGFLWKSPEEKELEAFASVSRSLASRRELALEGGTTLRFIQESDPLFNLFRSKQNTFLAVIIGVDSLQTFIESVGAEDVLEIFGRMAVRVKLDDSSWDIIAVDGNVL